MTCPFEILGLKSSASKAEVQATWRTLAGIHHPDRGGDPQDFDKYRQAFKAAIALAEEFETELLKCKECNGTGKITVRNGWSSITMFCPSC